MNVWGICWALQRWEWNQWRRRSSDLHSAYLDRPTLPVDPVFWLRTGPISCVSVPSSCPRLRYEIVFVWGLLGLKFMHGHLMNTMKPCLKKRKNGPNERFCMGFWYVVLGYIYIFSFTLCVFFVLIFRVEKYLFLGFVLD